MPEASGSSVPAWPAFCASKMRFTILTAWVEVRSTGLSRISQPSTFCPFLRLIVLILTGREVADDGGVVQQLLDPAGFLEGPVGTEADGGSELHLHRAPKLAAEIAGRAVQRLHGLVGFGAAERQHEGGGIAQVGADAHLCDGDDLAGEVR